jgi:hypothetical protein
MGRSEDNTEDKDADKECEIAKGKDTHELAQPKSLSVFNIFEVSAKEKPSKEPTGPNRVVENQCRSAEGIINVRVPGPKQAVQTGDQDKPYNYANHQSHEDQWSK